MLRRIIAKLSTEQNESGQAAIEYAVSTFYLVAVGVAAAPVAMHFMPDMMNALQIYLDGFYFIFSLPIP